MLELSFEGFEPALPLNAWNSIAAKLDADKKRRFVWWHAAIFLVAVVGLSILGKYFVGKAQKSDSVVVENANPVTQDAPVENGQTGTNNLEFDKIQGSNNAKLNTTKSSVTAQKYNTRKFNTVDKNSSSNTITAGNGKYDQSIVESADIKESLELNIGPMDIGYGLVEKSDLQLQENSEALKFHFPLKYATGGRFMLGASVGQVINTTNFTINSDYSNYVHRNFKKHVSEGEGLLGSVNLGFMAAYRVRSHWFVFTGLNLIQRKNSVNYQFSDAYPTVVSFQRTPDKFGNYPIVGYGPAGSISTSYKGINSFSQMDIPVGVMREFHLNKKWFILPSVGINYSIVTSNEGITLDYQTLETTQFKAEWLRKSMVSSFAGMGVFRNLGYSVKLGLNLSGNYMVTPMYVPGATIKPRALTGGLSTQLIWRID